MAMYCVTFKNGDTKMFEITEPQGAIYLIAKLGGSVSAVENVKKIEVQNCITGRFVSTRIMTNLIHDSLGITEEDELDIDELPIEIFRQAKLIHPVPKMNMWVVWFNKIGTIVVYDTDWHIVEYHTGYSHPFEMAEELFIIASELRNSR